MYHTPDHTENGTADENKGGDIPEYFPFPTLNHLNSPCFSDLVVVPKRDGVKPVGGYTHHANLGVGTMLGRVPEFEKSVVTYWGDNSDWLRVVEIVVMGGGWECRCFFNVFAGIVFDIHKLETIYFEL